MKKSLVINAVKYLFGFGILALLIWRFWKPGDPAGLQAVYQRKIIEGEPVHFGFFVLAIVCCSLAVLITFVRWYYLVRAQGLPFTLGGALRIGFIGYFWNVFLPGSIGGDVIKALFIAREQTRRTIAVATVIIDRVVGLWGLCWLVALLGGVFWFSGTLPENSEVVCKTIVRTAAAAVGVSLVAWVLLGFLPPRRAEIFAGRLERIALAGHALAEFWRAVWMYRAEARAVWLGLLLSLVGHVGFVLTFYFAALTIFDADQVPTLAAHFLVIPIGMAIQAGIPTPGGVGVGEAVFAGLYQLVGFPWEMGMLMSLTYRIVTWMLGFAGYLVYLQMRPAIKQAVASSAPAAA